MVSHRMHVAMDPLTTTVLFDADGVIQWPAPDRRAMWAALLDGRDHLVDEFFEALLAVERTCYCP